ncbi:peptidase M4 [Bacillus thuringiensis serovar roskildiensis]|uniref:Neutral metalloproteinase n=1 Tax=Bacillus thuringiensis serovar sooncheon TaxID=180891 RepID=A0A9Q5SDH6_BACTU|nr:M4 family metallopeptidase [Bacillus thuringiensis]MEB9661628.1 M4 family metallopeptidase [Bacillus cereus]ARV91117.1 peptidase M4 [Bacillus thuringiensis]OTW68806.1 peptidase M4 [Bacillus thuringiensis serovar coreanensis]OTX42698.1 peptidase M4 [Bacillus thuringiensis serovar sooncheon]OTX54414.1 peptidase M4 [Bacillus thuringiensis serovar guiyangiensis]
MKKTFVALVVSGITLSTFNLNISAEEDIQKQEVLKKMEIKQENWSDNQENISFLSGKLSDKKVENQKEIEDFLKENVELFKMDARTDLKLTDIKSDNLGMKHYNYVQMFKNVPIEGARFIIHTNKEGNVTAVNGDLHSNIKTNMPENTPKITKDEALSSAWEHININPNDTLVETKDNKVQGQEKLNSPIEKSEILIYEKDENYYLAYKVELQFIKPYGANWKIYVNAIDGTIIEATNLVEDAIIPHVGYGNGVLGDRKPLNTTYIESYGNYALLDITKPMNGGRIETYTALNAPSHNFINYSLHSQNNSWSDQKHAAAVDAHYNTGKVYDYYKNVHGRNSFDGYGATIRSTVNAGYNESNAYWNGSQMVYGDGDNYRFRPFSAALDVVAHELTHAVTQYTAGLLYYQQSGALNESFSDVFGYFLDPEDWDCGEDLFTAEFSGHALRSLSHPEKYGQPSHMNQYQYMQDDNGGVHINSGIPNKAAYLTINAIGKEKAELIYYRALTMYLTPTSDFRDARAALSQSALDFDCYYGWHTYRAVENAWNQVGVF